MECLDPACEALSFLPPPLRAVLMAVICSAPIWSIFFIVPFYRKRKGPTERHRRKVTIPEMEQVQVQQQSPPAPIVIAEHTPVREVVVEQLLDDYDDDDDDDDDEELPVEGSLEFYEFVQMWLTSRDENPHIMLDGNTGAGKTITAEALGQACIANGDQLLVINPGHREGQWDNHVITVDDDGDTSLLEATFRWLVYEVKRRGAEMKSKGVGGLRPLVIFWDELPETMEDIKQAGEFLRRVLRRGRAIKMYVIGIVQLDTGSEMNLKGRTGLKRGFRVMYLGNTARLKAPQLFDPDDEYPALLLWNGAEYVVDRSDLLDTANEPFPEEAFIVPDFTKVTDVDTVKWTEKHVQAVAFLLRNSNPSITAVTKHLYPKSNGSGPYRDRVKAIMAEVRAALMGDQKPSVEEFDDDDDTDEPNAEDEAEGTDRGVGQVAYR